MTTTDYAIGIDLGTTYSCVSVYRNGKVEIIANSQGNNTTPSWVAFNEHERMIGESAKLQQLRNLENTVYDAKRLMGKSLNDDNVKSLQKHLAYKLVEKDNKLKIVVKYKDEEKFLTPEEVSAMVLVKMKETAEAYLGCSVTKAVITVPAYFNDQQRQATKDAGTIAGLNVLRIINEPTAAAIAYGLDKKKQDEKHIIVFDCGGGTHDVSLLSIDEGVFEVKATAGNSFLGGEDIDNILVDFMKSEFLKQSGKVINNIKPLKRLKNSVEQAKRILSSTTTTNIELDSLFEGVDFQYTLTRAKFDELCNKFYQDTLEPVTKVLQDANISKNQIDELVLVGGTTRIPKIQQLLSDFFNGKELCRSINPDEAVAYGAAVQAALLSGSGDDNINDLLLLDVCPLSLGVETSGGIMTVIVPRNTTIPTKKTQTFSTYVDNQPGCSIQVYQGERKFAKDCVLLGSFNLSGIPPMPRGQPQIEITYDLDSNGILTVNALEKSSGKNEKITIKNDKNTLSKDDIDRMVKEAEKYADDDEKESQRLNTYNTLESSLYDFSSKLSKSELTDDEKNNSLDFVKEQQEWLSSNKLATNDLLNDKLNELNKYMEPFKDKLSTTNPTDNFNPADMMKNMNPDDMKGMQDMMKNMNPDELSKMMNMFKQPDNTKDNNDQEVD